MTLSARRPALRLVVALGLLAMTAVALFPPWVYTYAREGMAVVSNRHHVDRSLILPHQGEASTSVVFGFLLYYPTLALSRRSTEGTPLPLAVTLTTGAAGILLCVVQGLAVGTAVAQSLEPPTDRSSLLWWLAGLLFAVPMAQLNSIKHPTQRNWVPLAIAVSVAAFGWSARSPAAHLPLIRLAASWLAV